MTRNGGFRNLESVVLHPADGSFIYLQLMCASSHARAEDNKFGHNLSCSANYHYRSVQVKRKHAQIKMYKVKPVNACPARFVFICPAHRVTSFQSSRGTGQTAQSNRGVPVTLRGDTERKKSVWYYAACLQRFGHSN